VVLHYDLRHGDGKRMTLITFQDGKPLLNKDGKIGTEQACCCGGGCPPTECGGFILCNTLDPESNPCPAGFNCCEGVCFAEACDPNGCNGWCGPEQDCPPGCDPTPLCPFGCECVDGFCTQVLLCVGEPCIEGLCDFGCECVDGFCEAEEAP
jgi:hypothetical protein